jgi:hypothetical protein
VARFEIEVFTRFREEGIANIGRRIRDELRSIANDRSLTPAQQAERFAGTRLGAESALASRRSEALRGLQPGSQEYARTSAEFAKAQAAMRRAFNEIEQGSTRLGREIQGILTRAGASLPDAAAIGRARANPVGALAQQGAGEARQAAAVNAQVQQMLAADQDYVRETASAARAKAQISADVQRILATDREYIEATAIAAAARSRSNAQVQQMLAADSDYAQSQATIASAKAQQRAQTAALLAGDTAYTQAQITSAREKARQNAVIQESLAADQSYISAQARATAARAQSAAAIRAEVGAITGMTSVEQEAAQVLRARIAADRQAISTARLLSNAQSQLGQQAMRTAIDRRQAEARVTAALHAQERAIVRQIAADPTSGTRFQRLAARAQFGGQNRLPSELPTAGQFLGSRALTTVGYGLSGALLYGSIRAIGEMVDEAEQLQRVMNQLEAQFEAVGDGAQFAGAREAIAQISRDTGVNQAEVGESFRLLRGAFADTRDPGGPNAVALRETRAAMEIAQVTGLELTEVFDSLTATALSFDVSIRQVGDSALGLSERFGVPAREIIAFTADIAPLAAELGFSMEQVQALGAAAQRVSGRSGASLAEAFGRVLPSVQNAKNEILGLYETLNQQTGGQFEQQFNEVLQGFAAGDIEAVFGRLLRDYNKLSAGQKAWTLELLGGRRETQALAALLSNSGPLIREFDAQIAGSGRDIGKLSNYFDELRDTVQNTQARMSEAFRHLGDILFRAGIAEILTTAAGAATLLAGALNIVFGALARVNEASGGIVGQFIAWGTVTALLAKGLTLLTGVLTRKAVVTVADTTATTVNTAAQAAETTGSGAAAVANVANATALGTETAALATNTSAQVANAAAQSLGGVGGIAGGALRGGILGAGVGRAAGVIGGAFAAAPVLAAAGTIVAGGVVINKRQDVQKNVQGAEAKLIEKMSQATDAQLEEIANSTTSLLDRAAIRYNNAELPEELARKVLAIRRSRPAAADLRQLIATDKIGSLVHELNEDQLELLDEVFVRNGRDDPEFTQANLTKERIEGFIQQALQGDPFGANIVQLLGSFAQNNPAIAALIRQAIAETGELGAAKAAGGFGAAASIDLDAARAQLAAGDITEAQYEATLRGKIDRMRLLQETAGAGGIGFTPKDAQELSEREKELQEILLDRVERTLEVSERIRELQGTDSASASLSQLRGYVSGQVGGLDLAGRLELLPEYMAGLQDAFQEELDAIADPIERYNRAKAGFVIPEFAQTLVIAQQIQIEPQIAAFVAAAANFLGAGIDDIAIQLAEILRTTQLNVGEAARVILQQKITRLRAELADTTGLHIANETDRLDYEKEVARTQAELDKILATNPLTNVRQPTEPGARGGANAAQQRSLKEAADRERERREEEARRREDEAQREAEAAARARIDLLRAQASRDPVRLAELGIEAANLAAAQARTESERLQAAAERVNAIRSLEDAELDLWVSMQDYYGAVAEAAGDSVGVAQIQLGTIRERLRILTDQGFGHTAEANRLRAELVRAEAGLRDATFQDQLGDIDYLLELERISTGQAIEMLRAMMQIPTNTEEMNRDLERRIKSLQGELSQDFQFNLPSELTLPTLYEVRRLAQTAQGQSYQDNRQITVNFQANNVADAQAIAQGIADQFGAPSRFGTTPKRYP